MTGQTTTRRVTAADVARSLGLSRATVGFVLNRTPGQTIPEATRARVLAEAERLGYRPNTAAQALARGRSSIALLVLPDWPVDFALRVNLEEAGLLLDRAGYSLVTQTHHPEGRARPLWQTLQPEVVLGMLPFGADEVAAIRAAGVPHVITSPQDQAPADMPGVGEGVRAQVRHLAGRGHRTLGYARTDDPRLAWLQRHRSEAARRECDALGLPAPVEHAVGRTDGTAALDAWRAAGVTAVAAYNDECAATVVGAAVRRGWSVPGDLAVVGHDDSPLARLMLPSLSSARIDQASLGRYTAELILDAVGALGRDVAPPDPRVEVVVREST